MNPSFRVSDIVYIRIIRLPMIAIDSDDLFFCQTDRNLKLNPSVKLSDWNHDLTRLSVFMQDCVHRHHISRFQVVNDVRGEAVDMHHMSLSSRHPKKTGNRGRSLLPEAKYLNLRILPRSSSRCSQNSLRIAAVKPPPTPNSISRYG